MMKIGLHFSDLQEEGPEKSCKACYNLHVLTVSCDSWVDSVYLSACSDVFLIAIFTFQDLVFQTRS